MSRAGIERKSFTYHTSARWLGQRVAWLESDHKESFRIASPPEFRGEPGVWTPEDLFVASVETCFLLTFAGLVEKRKLPVQEFSSRSEGLLEFVEDGYEFTRVLIRPTVTVSDRTAVPHVITALEDAKRGCLIARSMSAPVTIDPTVEVVPAE